MQKKNNLQILKHWQVAESAKKEGRKAFSEMINYLTEHDNIKIAIIEIETNKLLNSLQEQNYFQGLESQQLIPKLADLYCELNVIHPFREGYGRTQRIFFEHLIAHCGYGIDWSHINSKDQ